MKIVELPVGGGNAVLTGYLLDASQEFANITARPAVLVLPGGGYALCSDREAEPIAMAYLAQGFHAFVLRYTVGTGFDPFPSALAEAEQALETLRSHAADWRLDPERIAAVGFSVGGHLAACLGTMGKTRPNALVLGYPVITASWGRTVGLELPAADRAVTADTPPAFLFAAQGDKIVPVENSLAFAAALVKAGVPFEQHIYLTGQHGVALSIAATSAGNPANADRDMAAWFGQSVRFLQNLWGDFALFAPDSTAADRPWVERPLPDILQNPAAAEALERFIPGLDGQLPPGMSLSLRRMAQFSNGQITDDMLDQIEQALAQVLGPAANH